MKFAMKCKILTMDVPNGNDRIYPSKVIARALKNVPDPLPLSVDMDYDFSRGVPLDKQCGVTLKLHVEGNDLFADVRLFDTPRAEEIRKALAEGRLHVRTMGSGKLDDNIVHDYGMIGLGLTDDPA